MTATLDETLAGANMEGGEVFCDDLYNNLKNHWRDNYGGDPCASGGLEYLQPGMIISDSYDDRLYHVIHASGCPCSEIVQTCIPVPDDVPVYFGYEFDGAIYYDELTNDEFTIEAKNAANVEGVTINLLETNQRFRIRQNADYISMYCTATDTFFTWSDGALNLQTDEADTNSVVHIHGAGTGRGGLQIFDEDDAEYLQLLSSGGAGFVRTGGATPGILQFQNNIAQNISCWSALGAGNSNFRIYGWITAGGAIRYSQFRMDDTNDEFLIEAENNANHEGITINLLETNQRFRIRQNADYMLIYLDGSNAYLTWSDGALNLQTEEVDAVSNVHIHGNGTGYGRCNIYDADDAEYLQIQATTGYGDIRVRGAAPAGLRLQYQQHQNITCWLGITEGNPRFLIYGWNTAAGAVVYSRFQMDDVNDEFLIEAQNSVNHEGITISLQQTDQRFRVRQNADYMAMYLTATDAYLTWTDGALNLQTTEADTDTTIHIHGAGTGRGILNIFDEDDAEWLDIRIGSGAATIRTQGAAPLSLAFQTAVPQEIICWAGIAAGNPSLVLYGWITAGGTRRYSQFRMDDVNDEFLIEAENSVNHEGITVSLLETNQRFRVRQNADYIAMYLSTTDAFFTWSDGALNLMTDEGTDTETIVNIKGKGTLGGRFKIFGAGATEYLEMVLSGGVGRIATKGTAPGGLNFQQFEEEDIRFWSGIAAGNPDFSIYGWNTAAGAVVYGRFRMEDTYDEFFIEAENSMYHAGITVSLLEAAQEFRIRGVGGAERFHIDQTGILGYMRQGELFQWTYQGDLADDASFNLPAFTDACWGFIQAGDNEEYALFSVDNVGNVTLITNSANVVANADTDGKLCLGILSPEEPLTIRNRLGATENINLIIWYS